MNTVEIPTTRLRVSPICLGTGEVGSSLDEQASFALLDAYVEHGGNFLDTAHDYGNWVPDLEPSASEATIGRWLRARRTREQIVLATKGGMGSRPDRDSREMRHLARTALVAELEDSLRILQTDHIDLYWLHRDDPREAVGEIIETLSAQVAAGKIRSFGASNWKVPRIREAQAYAREHGLPGFVADQSMWNAAVLAGPGLGHASLGWMDDGGRYDFHLQTGMPLVAYQSQAYGLFQRLHHGTLDQMRPRFRDLYRLPETMARYERMRAVMASTGYSISQVVLGYLTSQPFLTMPIVGCQRPEQVRDSLSAAEIRLTPDQLEFIDRGAAVTELSER